jgi:hypothetical protein
MDHGGDDRLPVHHGLVAKASGAHPGASTRSRCGARKLTLTAEKRREVDGCLTEGFRDRLDGKVRPATGRSHDGGETLVVG